MLQQFSSIFYIQFHTFHPLLPSDQVILLIPWNDLHFWSSSLSRRWHEGNVAPAILCNVQGSCLPVQGQFGGKKRYKSINGIHINLSRALLTSNTLDGNFFQVTKTFLCVAVAVAG